MNLITHSPEPVEPTFTLELTLRELTILAAALGTCGGDDSYALFDALDDVVRAEGDPANVGDLRVSSGPLVDYSERYGA